MPFVTVVTDLGGAHPSWFNGGVDRCFMPSDVLRDAALDRNIDSSRIVQYGLPIRRRFWRFGRTGTSRAARRPATSRRKCTRTWTSQPSGSDWYCRIVGKKSPPTLVGDQVRRIQGGEFDRDTDTPIIGAGMCGHVYYQAGTHGPSHNHNKHSSHCGSLTRGIWMVSTWTMYNISR